MSPSAQHIILKSVCAIELSLFFCLTCVLCLYMYLYTQYLKVWTNMNFWWFFFKHSLDHNQINMVLRTNSLKQKHGIESQIMSKLRWLHYFNFSLYPNCVLYGSDFQLICNSDTPEGYVTCPNHSSDSHLAGRCWRRKEELLLRINALQ